ncbi:ribonucleases P/MRP protein subunit POP1-like isoform X2 [Amphibalanus amphitrite]|uniref:ribonucleases P/MRP protein subunit POP1-like isoform X2 n=2 Tax=Amphibalanus amphitrite TaxID=1232801 RepID=UPI001C90B9EF|nr:ribonucleases P/MRP protein subunit POP1-like isoform X2 [Amphibalanus amphitrite]XP_043193851.1 ribonucleases P/MRP protein subunit POP1-like isoform X2 [Amphibalanus amphitrite]
MIEHPFFPWPLVLHDLRGIKMAEGPAPEPVLTGKNISFLELTSERATEIQRLTDAIDNPNRTKMVYQRLPRHMQRRAMSHDPKRLPVRARQAFTEQRDLTQMKVSKRPSRRHRRRPSNLLLEYNRRQREHLWLETHIWHARRFHMVHRWGFKLPESATDKGFRAAYRATAHHCLVQDVSYLCQLELSGPQSALLSALTSLSAGGAGSARLLSGRHQGRLLLRSSDPPHRPLAPVSILWGPADGAPRRALWLWVHPAGYDAVRDALVAAIGASGEPEEVEVEQMGPGEDGGHEGGDAAAAEEGDKGDGAGDKGGKDEVEGEEPMECDDATPAGDVKTPAAKPTSSAAAADTAYKKKNVDQIKLAPRRLHILRRWTAKPKTTTGRADIPAGTTDTDTAADNKDTTTTTSTPVHLTELKGRMVRFRLSGPGSQAVLQSCLRVAADPPPAWDTAERLEAQRRLWKAVGEATSPGELPPGCVMGLTVDDPRRHLPQQRTKAIQRPEELSDEPVAELPAGSELSPLWDESVRHQVTTTKLSDNLLNRARGHLLVPGATAESLRLPPVPVILLQNHRCPGWDLLLPPGWGMAFWVALQYSGARAGGLRETERMALETGELRFPAEYPDSAAGREWEREDRQRRREEYFKRPPAKRPNFVKLGVPDPFSCWWSRLVTRLCPVEGGTAAADSDTPMVCRDPATLRLLSAALTAGSGRPAALPAGSGRLLVAVRARATGRGVPRSGALLCLPSPEDNPSAGAAAGAVRPLTEPPAEDPAEERRDKLRTAWLKKQVTEKRKRHRCRRRQQADQARQAAARLAEQRQGQRTEMERLSLPPADLQPHKQLIGHVTSGDFCLSEAVGRGTGFVVLEGLLRLLDIGGGPRLLFRNIDTDTYRWCTLTLITEPC